MTLTRRRFLMGCGAAVASTALGCRSGDEQKVHDVCIVGSGFAGSYLALRLAERGFDTAIVEAGALPTAPRPPGSFAYTNSGKVEYPIGASRVIGLGGSSNHWSGLLTRLRPADFELQTRFGVQQDWPISYADLEPYYCEAEALLAARGHPPLAGAEPPRSCAYPAERAAAPALDAELDGAACEFFPVAHSSRDGQPVRLLAQEIPRLEASAQASLLRDLQATRLVSQGGGRVDHLLARRPDGGSQRIRARTFVVAAGVVESARLLLLSRGELPMQGESAEQVGSHFHIHPLLESRRRLRLQRPVARAIHQTSSLADVYRRRGLNAVDYQLVASDHPGLGLRALLATEARAQNRIRLSATLDPVGEPVADLSFGYSERDQRTFAHCNQVLGRSESAAPVGMAGADSYRWHPAGTCRMGANAGEGVVDGDNRVFGVDNLYVSGACTFPNSGVANPTDTVVALTLRLGDHLTKRLS
jgi:choline dehydrogenase-like flavoprotein